jgi:Tol biopolymer transport system component
VATEGIIAGFSVSSTGALVFRTGQSSDRVLSWYDRNGRTTGKAWVPGQYTEAVLSPDDSRVAVVRGELNGKTDIYVYEFAGGRSIRVTSTPEFHGNPVWSSRGDKILYTTRGSRVALLQKPADGAGNEEVLLKFDHTPSHSSWSRDGRVLMVTMPDPRIPRRDLEVLRMDGELQVTKFLQTEFNESSGQFSPEPDGPKYLAYVSDESGKDEVYVSSFPDRSRGKWAISTNGGVQPRWRRDGRELLYFTPDGKLMSVDVTLTPSFKPGPPRQLFQAPILFGGTYSIQSRWDVTSDGQRFLVIASPNETSSPVSVVLNWQSLLKKQTDKQVFAR